MNTRQGLGLHRELALWTVGVGVSFSFAALLSLVATDLMFVSNPHASLVERLVRTREPLFLLGFCLPPGLVAAFAFRRWCVHRSRLFGGWGSISAAAWLALVFNPIAYALVMTSLFLLGFLVLALIAVTGLVMSAAWALSGARMRLQP
jgi:hypothetical protein